MIALRSSRRRPPLPRAPYIVVGLGHAGVAAARALAARAGPERVTVWDGRNGAGEQARGAALAAEGIRSVHDPSGVELMEQYDEAPTLVKSPGISFETTLIAAAHRRGWVIIDEAELGWRLDERPVVAVTGTNGKSTTASLLLAILRAEGRSPLLAGNTTFGTPYSAAPVDGDLVVAELSSFQLEGCPELLPDAAVLTNITDDHLYRHGTRDRYEACKRRAFLRAEGVVPVAAIGIDEPPGRRLAEDLRRRGSRVVTFGRHPAADRRVLTTTARLDGSRITVTEGDGERTLSSPLIGLHNAINIAGALALADGLGIAPARAAATAEAVTALPGRFERVEGTGDVHVLVDFAHNPDGVLQALTAGRTVLEAAGRGQLRVLLSTLSLVGARQASEMSRIAAELADHLLLTTQRVGLDEPGDRLPAGLLEGARSVLGTSSAFGVELDRAAAIRRVLHAAEPGDLVLILDRGERRGQLLAPDGTTRSHDDRAHARAALSARAAAASSTSPPCA